MAGKTQVSSSCSDVSGDEEGSESLVQRSSRPQISGQFLIPDLPLLDMRDYIQEELASLSPMFDPDVTGIGGYTLLDIISIRARRKAPNSERQREAQEQRQESPSNSECSGNESCHESSESSIGQPNNNLPGPSRKRKRRAKKVATEITPVNSPDHKAGSPIKQDYDRKCSGKRIKLGEYTSFLHSGSSASCIRANNAGESTSEEQEEKQPSKNIVALDCEMVSCIPTEEWEENAPPLIGKHNKKHSEVMVAARCAIVDYNYTVLYDSYISTEMRITNLRGISPEKMKSGTPFKLAREEILRLLKDKLVVGHDIEKDFRMLQIHKGRDIPTTSIRDTSTCPLLHSRAEAAGVSVGAPNASLKDLAKGVLKRSVQKKKPHNPVEDATVTMELHREVESEWEKRCSSSRDDSSDSSAVESDSDESSVYGDCDSDCSASDFEDRVNEWESDSDC